MGKYVYDVMEYGADPTGSTLSTKAIQDAINAAAAAGGGTVAVPSGRYTIGTIRLRSNIRIELCMGAVLKGSADIDDYQEEQEGFVPPEFPYVRCLFVGLDLENIEFTGGGTIDGSGASFMDYSKPTFDTTFTEKAYSAMPKDRSMEFVSEHTRKRPTWIFFFRRCRNIRFRDIRIVDAARWTTRFSRCENIVMSGLFIENDLRAANSDGMHFTGCTNTIISDCSICSGDDCIAVTSYGDNDSVSKNTVITNCILRSHSAGIRIGFNGESIIEDITVSNCVFTKCNRGIGIFSGKNATVRHILISNVRMDTRLIAGIWWGKAEPLLITTLGENGLIEDISVQNLSAQCEQGIIMDALPSAAIRNIRLNGIDLCARSGPMSPFAAGTLDLRPRSIERRNLPVFFAQGIDRLMIKDLTIAIENDARGFFPQMFEFHGCTDLDIAGLSSADPSNSGEA